MRIDEINIIGEFKINGLTGSPGQALGLSGSEFTWITVSASSVIDAVGLTGTDYVICQSVNTGNPGTDAIENGNRLRSAYATASGLYVSNRVSVLITPGDYDLDSTSLQMTTDKVDLIGLSSDASDVILRGSGPYVLQIMNNNTDTALCNVTIDGSSTTYYAFDNSECSGCYLRWDNVIATGNIFTDDNYSYSELNGEFKNIKVHDSAYAFNILGDINGTYDNIEFTNVGSTFYVGGSIFGTYSNINLKGTVFFCFAGSSINATFENIKSENIDNSIFSSGGGILNGKFKNIEIGDVSNIVLSGNSLDGIFENIKIGNVTSNVLNTYSGNLTGTFSNIEVGNVSSVFTTTSGEISGSFKDITVGNVGFGSPNNSGKVFTSGDSYVSGKFKNIKLGNLIAGIDGSGISFANISGSSGYVSGTFENIEGKECGVAFYTLSLIGGGISGTFSNIKFENITGSLFLTENANSINGTFENITCGTVSNSLFCATGNLGGTFKDITIGNSIESFRTLGVGGNITGTYENIKVGNTPDFFVSLGTMSGTFSNIEMGNGNSVFYSGNNLLGTYENIKIGTCSNAFYSTTSDINGYFDTIEIDGFGSNSKFFAEVGNLYGTYKNIKIKNTHDLFVGGHDINGTFENIEFTGNSNKVFFASVGDVSGTFSNITSSSLNGELFSAGAGVISGYFKDMTFGTVSIFMNASSIGSSTVVDNLKFNGRIESVFPGKIINSFVNNKKSSGPPGNRAIVLGDGAIVERCKFLSGVGQLSIKGDTSAQISFTITNGGIQGDINNIISDPKNIDNPNIT